MWCVCMFTLFLVDSLLPGTSTEGTDGSRERVLYSCCEAKCTVLFIRGTSENKMRPSTQGKEINQWSKVSAGCQHPRLLTNIGQTSWICLFDGFGCMVLSLLSVCVRRHAIQRNLLLLGKIVFHFWSASQVPKRSCKISWFCQTVRALE